MLRTSILLAALLCVSASLHAQASARPVRQCTAGVCSAGEAAAQAATRGVDYNALVRRAASNDTAALRLLFRLSNSRVFTGPGATDHCEVLRALLVRWQDARFSGVLQLESMTTQFAVSRDLAAVAKPGDTQKYPRSFLLSAPA